MIVEKILVKNKIYLYLLIIFIYENLKIYYRLTSNNGTSTRMIILGDDALRSQYVPPKPTVKILKRPSRNSQGSGDGPLLNGEKPKQPIKSLKQVCQILFL